MKRKRKNDSQKKDETFQGEVFLFTQKKLKRQKKKQVEKKRRKNEERKIQKEDTNRRESRRERKKNGWKKGYTKEVFKKEAREIFKKCKNQEWTHVFEKRGRFLAHEKVLAQDQGGEKHFLFFQRRKRKVDQKNTFFKEWFIKRTHFFCFLFFG